MRNCQYFSTSVSQYYINPLSSPRRSSKSGIYYVELKSTLPEIVEGWEFQPLSNREMVEVGCLLWDSLGLRPTLSAESEIHICISSLDLMT